MRYRMIASVILILMIALAIGGCTLIDDLMDKKPAAPKIQPQATEPVESPFVEYSLEATDAINGYIKSNGLNAVQSNISRSYDCAKGLALRDDNRYCNVSKVKESWDENPDAGASEIFFKIPDNISPDEMVNATIYLEVICSSGLNTYFLTEFDEWAAYDLSTQIDSPIDGSGGYLSCRYGARERKIVRFRPQFNNRIAGIRIIKSESTAFAQIDYARLDFLYPK